MSLHTRIVFLSDKFIQWSIIQPLKNKILKFSGKWIKQEKKNNLSDIIRTQNNKHGFSTNMCVLPVKSMVTKLISVEPQWLYISKGLWRTNRYCQEGEVE